MTKARDRDIRWGSGFVTKRGEKWQARWSDGERWRAKTFATEDDAYDHLRSINRAKRGGSYAPPSIMTVDDLITEHLERAARRLSERTILTYRQRQTTMITPYLGGRRIADLTTIEVQRWIDRLGKSFAASSIHPAIAVLMAACREAKVLGIIDRNPAEGIRRPTIARTKMRTWTEEEARRVLAVVDGDVLFHALYHLALATGMRPGELRALKWIDVDIEHAVIHVRRKISKDVTGQEVITEGTKTQAVRAVAVSKQVLHALKWHRSRQTERHLACMGWRDMGLVFDRGDGHWMYQSFWWREHQRICKRAGVPLIRCHDIRHTSASLELAAGTHPKIVADRLGHSSIEITLDLYSHVSPDLQRAAADALAERLFGNATTSEQNEAKL